jgi:hypothetical protein
MTFLYLSSDVEVCVDGEFKSVADLEPNQLYDFDAFVGEEVKRIKCQVLAPSIPTYTQTALLVVEKGRDALEPGDTFTPYIYPAKIRLSGNTAIVPASGRKITLKSTLDSETHYGLYAFNVGQRELAKRGVRAIVCEGDLRIALQLRVGGHIGLHAFMEIS